MPHRATPRVEDVLAREIRSQPAPRGDGLLENGSPADDVRAARIWVNGLELGGAEAQANDFPLHHTSEIYD
jgi:hypothetical protein